MKRLVVLAGVGGLVLAGSVLGIAGPAQAHNYVVSTTPGAGATITSQPDAISVTTNDTLLDLAGNGSGFGMRVQDSAGLYYGDGCITIANATMSTDAPLGAAGTYTVTWQVISTDGHPVSNTFQFVWAPATPSGLAQGAAAVPDCNGTKAQATATAVDTGGASGDTTVFWVVGAILIVGLAISVTLFVLRPKKK